MKLEHIVSILKESDRWGVNYQPRLETFANFLAEVADECGLDALEVLSRDTVRFRTKRPLTPSLAFRLGLMMFDGGPREIESHQTEFTLWWD